MKAELGSKKSRVIHLLFILGCSLGGMVFVGKLFSFLRTLKSEEMSDFAADPIIIYGFVAMGFLFLLGWAFLSGQFSNIEQPKYDMLTKFAELEAEENEMRRAAKAQSVRAGGQNV